MNMTVFFAESNMATNAELTATAQAFEANLGSLGTGAATGFEESTPIAATLYSSDQGFTAGMSTGGGSGGLPAYSGAYEVTPKVTAQKLETAMKSMTEDVTVHAIPYYEVDNAYQGQTVIIGGS